MRPLLRVLPLLLASLAPRAQAACPGSPDQSTGYRGIENYRCLDKGCCYDPAPGTIGVAGAQFSSPVCFYPNTGQSSYALQGDFLQEGRGLSGSLALAQGTAPELGPDVRNLTLHVENVTPDILHVKIGAQGRWEVPPAILDRPNATVNGGPAEYSFNYTASPFAFAVSRTSKPDVPLFTTAGSRLVFKDQYLELTTAIPASAALYGLGERSSSVGIELARDGLPLALWNRDSQSAFPDQNIYGSHPFILDNREDGTAHGILLLNSNAMDVVLTNTTLQWRATGGILDLYFFLGPSPNAVVQQLTSVIGRPIMPPYWSMGLMQSKYGYGSTEFYYTITRGYDNASLPLDTFISDSQYMDHDQDFTLGAQFPMDQMKAFVSYLHKRNQRWVPILDPGIHIKKGYAPYDTGIEQDVFIRDIKGDPYIGQLWPGSVHWPDFQNPATDKWWANHISNLAKDLPLDGLWLDMNEVSNYCTGDVCMNPDAAWARNDFVCMIQCYNGPLTYNASNNPKAVPVPPAYYNPPYQIANGNARFNLSYKTLPVTASHFDGSLEYNQHNLYGLYETAATARTLRALRGKRQFILTRSTFIGSGAYAAHWNGDSDSTWNDIRWSLSTLLTNGMAGIPFTGSDICGFGGGASEELCARWAVSGAFYPFARVHTSRGFQELFRWDRVAEASRKAFGLRYRAMPYIYSAFFDSHTFGCPVARAPFFAFPADRTTRNLYDQWFLGDALLVSPVLKEGASSVDAYFPQGYYYSAYDGTPVDASDKGRYVNLPVSVTDNVPVHILGGNVVAMATGRHMTTVDVQNSTLTLIVAFPKTANTTFSRCASRTCGSGKPGVLSACGHMYLDGGEELEVGRALDNYLDFTAESAVTDSTSYSGNFTARFSGTPGGDPGAGCTSGITWPIVESIVLLGVPRLSDANLLLQTVAPARTGGSNQVYTASAQAPTTVPLGAVAYDEKLQKLTLTKLRVPLACPTGLQLSWSSQGKPQGAVTLAGPQNPNTGSAKPVLPGAAQAPEVAAPAGDPSGAAPSPGALLSAGAAAAGAPEAGPVAPPQTQYLLADGRGAQQQQQGQPAPSQAGRR